jgi:hypothetical protein
MQYKGINYDTGTKTTTGKLTREIFDPDVIAREIGIIRNELHCNAIRISGIDTERIVKAAEIALKLGMAVWFSPTLHYRSQGDTLKHIAGAATAAENLRRNFHNLIFVAGCELSLFTHGFVKGETGNDRLKNLFGPLSLLKNSLGIKRKYNRLLNAFLSTALVEIRNRFYGKVTYASGAWEKIDWEEFDFIGVDLYRSIFNKSAYDIELRNYVKLDKPLCITEFGCCTFHGADDKGAMGWAIVDWKKEKPELRLDYVRSEETQAKYIIELLTIFDSEKVTGAFVFTFISGNYIYDENPKYDLDMGSYGIVKALKKGEAGYKDLPWTPKQAFFELGNYYKEG